jgi:ADP-ribose pyrophosphatase
MASKKKADTELVYPGKFIQMRRRGTWEFATRPKITGIIGIVAVTQQGELLLIEQHRPPLNASVIEIPAGLAGDVAGARSESLASAARRELLEETGFACHSLKKVAAGASSAGLTDEIITLFLAKGLRKVGDGHGDGTERITTHLIPLAKVPGWLARQEKKGKIIDLKVYSALYFAAGIS